MVVEQEHDAHAGLSRRRQVRELELPGAVRHVGEALELTAPAEDLVVLEHPHLDALGRAAVGERDAPARRPRFRHGDVADEADRRIGRLLDQVAGEIGRPGPLRHLHGEERCRALPLLRGSGELEEAIGLRPGGVPGVTEVERHGRSVQRLAVRAPHHLALDPLLGRGQGVGGQVPAAAERDRREPGGLDGLLAVERRPRVEHGDLECRDRLRSRSTAPQQGFAREDPDPHGLEGPAAGERFVVARDLPQAQVELAGRVLVLAAAGGREPDFGRDRRHQRDFLRRGQPDAALEHEEPRGRRALLLAG